MIKFFIFFSLTCLANFASPVQKKYEGVCVEQVFEHTDVPVLDYKEFHTGGKQGLDHWTFSYEMKLICETKRFCALIFYTQRSQEGEDYYRICPYFDFNKVVCSEDNEIVLRRTKRTELYLEHKALNVTIGLEIYHTCDEDETVKKSVVFLSGNEASECNFYQFTLNLTENGSPDFDEPQSLRFQYDNDLRLLRAETDLLNGDKFTEDDMDTLLNDSSRYRSADFQDCFSTHKRDYYGFTFY
ncbi:hypothetical protein CAEBREN_09318 [Caenorhabditis brenneri]|uniref:Uncharacterized protein n=1 Tax=Caenorhabditis brenneri TaxID=135651 RepID=G0N4D1_CAEBE|nr:hypothetical protein CAEBREN_09318 [Caenorhabditis brenneri]